MSEIGSAASLPLARERTRLRGARDRLGGAGVAALAAVGILVFLAVLGPLLAPQDPDAIDLGKEFAGPSSSNLLGADDQGRDLLSRLLVGARTSLLAPLLIVLAATTIGTAVAIGSAWRGGFVDEAVGSLVNALFAFPGVLLAVFAVALMGRGLLAPVVALAIAYVPYLARVARAAALRERALPYVDALMVQGVSAWKICVGHIAPNIAPVVVGQATVAFGYAVVDLAAISFLSLGVQPPDSDWGSMIAQGNGGVIQGHPEQSLYAGACLVVAVASFNILGNRLADRRVGFVR